MRAVGGVWYAPIVYLVVALVLLCFIAFGRGARVPAALIGSGVVYELSLFPFAPSADVRYSHWLTVATLITLVMVVHRRALASRAP